MPGLQFDLEEFAQKFPEQYAEQFPEEAARRNAEQAAKNPVRVEGGKKAKARGESFEKRLDSLHGVYDRKGLATFDRLHKPMAMIRGKWIPTGDAPYDFTGILGPNSPFPHRPIMLEVKACSKRAASLLVKPAKRRGETKEEKRRRAGFGVGIDQLRALRRLRAWGAVVGLVWCNGEHVGILRNGEVASWHEKASSTEERVRIPASAFYYLDKGDDDYLEVLTKHAAREAKSKET